MYKIKWLLIVCDKIFVLQILTQMFRVQMTTWYVHFLSVIANDKNVQADATMGVVQASSITVMVYGIVAKNKTKTIDIN